MPLGYLQRIAALLLLASTCGCGGLIRLLTPPQVVEDAGFVVVTRKVAWEGPLTTLTERAQAGLEKQGASLVRVDATRAKYELLLPDQKASLVLRQEATSVKLKVVARGPYGGALALRVSACTKILRQAAEAATSAPVSPEPTPLAPPEPEVPH